MTKLATIYKDLYRQITTGQYRRGDYLPSESDLAKQYGSSRDTIRKALSKLAQVGAIQKINGKGSLVLKQERLPLPTTGIVSLKELTAQLGVSSTNEVLSLTKTTLPVAAFAPLVPDLAPLPVTGITVLHRIAGEALIIDHEYIDRQIVPEVPRAEVENSLYVYFEQKLGLTITNTMRQITVDPATPEDQHYLRLPKMGLVVVVRGVTSLSRGERFQYSESHHRPDRFKFVQFANRV